MDIVAIRVVVIILNNMGCIKEIYIQLKRDYPNWDDKDLPYLFEQYVHKHKINFKKYAALPYRL